MSGEFKGKKATNIPLGKHSEWHASVALFYLNLLSKICTLAIFFVPLQGEMLR